MTHSRYRLWRKAATVRGGAGHAAERRRGLPGLKRPVRRASVRLLVVGAVLALAAPAALAATYGEVDISNPDGVEEDDRWGERMRVGDLNGDGVDDLLVGVPFHDVNSKSDVGRVYALDGDTLDHELDDDPLESPNVLYEIDSPTEDADSQFGFFVSVPGDVVGDGRDDVVVGANLQDVDLNTDQGNAWLFDGSDGSLVHELENPNPQAGQDFGERIGRAGDVDGDGTSDIIVGAPGTEVDGVDRQGQAYIISPKDDDNDGKGDHIRTLDMPDPESEGTNFGLAVQGPGDIVGDSTVDHYVNAALYDGTGSNQGRSYVFDGADGSLAMTIDSPEPQDAALFGFQDVTPHDPGDVNGDGVPELYGNGFHQNVDGTTGDSCTDTSDPDCNENQGKAWVFDGATGDPLYQLNDPKQPQPGGTFGWSMTQTDYNGDSTPDLYIGQAPHAHDESEPEGGNGGTYVFDGTDQDTNSESEDAAVLDKELEFPDDCESGNNPAALGWSVAAPGDIDGSGQEDYTAGAPFTNVEDDNDKQDAGIVIFFGSATADDMDDCNA